MSRVTLLGALCAMSLLTAACSGNGDGDPRLGGDASRDDASTNAFGLPAPTLTNEERRLFEIGDSFFTKNWVTAPASTEDRDGLGPLFNAQACSSCHVLDGRGLLPATGAEKGLLLRLSVPGSTATGAPKPHDGYGGQLQDVGVLGVPAEGRVAISYVELPGQYGDGTRYSLRAPSYSIADPAYGEPGDDLMIGPRLAPQVIGMGLLEAIPEAHLLAAVDVDDADGDGVSGRVNRVWDVRRQAPAVGRFGWKANQPTVEQQVADAFHGDIGVTSPLNPTESCSDTQGACRDAPNGGSPEIDERRLAAVTFYSSTLSVPTQRGHLDAAVRRGDDLFASFGCSGCHTASQRTGGSPVLALANQTIRPYTDLLLHDMGPGLADGRPDFDASGTEWRTPPLWGLGLIDDVNGERFLLHDGRARSVEEAILWHGGEAEQSKERFRTASAGDRADLVTFLESL